MAKKTKSGLVDVNDCEYSHLNMTIKEAAEVFKLASLSGLPLMLYGSPGVGKTSLPRQMYKELGYDSCIIFTPAQDDVIDWKLPYLDTVEVEQTTASGTRTERISRFAVSERIPRTGRHVLVVDEINTASMSLQPTLYSFVLEGSVSGHSLPPGCMRVATGNRESDSCAAQPMSAALKDRLAIAVNVIPDVNSWCEWAAKNQLHPAVIGFVRQSPECLHGINPDDVVAGCTPRSLEQLSRMMITNSTYGDNAPNGNQKFSISKIESKVFSGMIGRGHGIEFAAFLDIYRNKVDIDRIMKDPKTAPLPTDGSLSYATVMSLVGHTNKTNFKKILSYVERLEPTYTFCYILDVQFRCPEVTKVKEFTNYLTTNYNLFI